MTKQEIEEALKEFSESERKEIIRLGEKWAKEQGEDTGVWWKCPSVWKKIKGGKKRKSSADSEYVFDEDVGIEVDINDELEEVQKMYEDDPEGTLDILNNFILDLDEEIDLDRTAGIRRALKALGKTRAKNKKKYLSGAKKGFKIGEKTVSKETFTKKIGGVPKSWKKSKKDSVQRYDFFPLEIEIEDSYMEEKFKRTPDGYLKGRAIVTNIGVFPYRMLDGSIKNELRLPEEVFDVNSMGTLKNLPLGNEHPVEGSINVDNIKKYQVGFSGDDIRKDEYHLSNSLTWTDGDTIEEIRGGKRGLSCGYKVDLEETSGVWMGMHYDAIQRNIRYNHIVVTDVGRAGDAARIKMDSGDAVCVQKINQEGVSMMKKIKIDGVEYDAEAPVITAYTQTQTELETLKADASKEIDELKADNQKLEAERDQLKEECEKFKEDAKNDEGSKKEELEKAIQSRLNILDSAKRAEVEVKKDMSELDIKKEVIVKLFPGAKEKLDSADEVYINARFDGCLEKLDELEKERQETTEQLKGDSINNKNPEVDKYDSDAAYKRMVEREQNLWKGEDK